MSPMSGSVVVTSLVCGDLGEFDSDSAKSSEMLIPVAPAASCKSMLAASSSSDSCIISAALVDGAFAWSVSSILCLIL